MTKIDFGEWLQNEMNLREWSQSDIARKSGLSTGQISRLLNGTRGPGLETCQAIANAFNLPQEQVMQNAGLLSTPEEQSEIITTTLYNLGFLPIEDQEEILEIIKLKRTINERREKYRAEK
jgi:transcriptional regulator with XRE-family HTH domain